MNVRLRLAVTPWIAVLPLMSCAMVTRSPHADAGAGGENVSAQPRQLTNAVDAEAGSPSDGAVTNGSRTQVSQTNARDAGANSPPEAGVEQSEGGAETPWNDDAGSTDGATRHLGSSSAWMVPPSAGLASVAPSGSESDVAGGELRAHGVAASLARTLPIPSKVVSLGFGGDRFGTTPTARHLGAGRAFRASDATGPVRRF